MIKRLFALVFMLLFCGSCLFAQNTLTIPNVTIAKGKSVSLPVRMNNTADIVAVQFTLTLPDGVLLDVDKALLSERASAHSLTVRRTAANQYVALLFSGSNAPVSGSAGELLSVDLTVSSNVVEDSLLPMKLSDVVMSAPDGRNLVDSYEAGGITVALSPDFEVSSLSFDATEANPGETVVLGWQVANVGGVDSRAGWSETIYLNSPNGEQKLLATMYCDEILAAGAVLSRSAEVRLPELPGIDGNATFSVRLTANKGAGEQPGAGNNNIASSESTVLVGKRLVLSPVASRVDEASARNVRYHLARSGNTRTAETFTIAAVQDNRVALPSAVTIEKGHSGVYFYSQITPNGVMDSDSVVSVVVDGNGYAPVTAQMLLVDDTDPAMTITAGVEEIVEGEELMLAIGIERPLNYDLPVELAVSDKSRFTIPSSIVIPAGETGVQVKLLSTDDATPDVDWGVSFTAYAAAHRPATVDVVLKDNDLPTLKIELQPGEVSESAGPLSVIAKIKRTSNIDKSVRIKLSDNSDGAIYYSKKDFVMAAGVEEVTLNLGPVDNALNDGERSYFVNAAVYIEKCNCSAGEGTVEGLTTAKLTVIDDDCPALSATSSASVLKEGGCLYVTVTRNTSVEDALTVYISSQFADGLNIPSQVVIPAGQASASFVVESSGNDDTGDGYTATVTLSAQGYSKANVWFSVSDQTLPDAQITGITALSDAVTVGGTVEVEATLVNTGSYALPAETQVAFYLNGMSSPSATAYLSTALEPGATAVVRGRIVMPGNVGTYNIHAVVNEGNNVPELAYNNNHSKVVSVRTTSPFSAVVSVSNSVIARGGDVTISGTIACENAVNREVEVYVINSGYRHTIAVTTDADGKFQALYTPYSGQSGHFSVGACYPGENLVEEMVSFYIYGLKRASSSPITIETFVGETFVKSFDVQNTGVLDLTGVKAVVRSKPDNCDVSIECPQIIKGGESASVECTVVANAQTPGDDWERILVDITTDEGACLETVIYSYCRTYKAQLRASVARINTTMTKGFTRDYVLSLTNTGKNATGKITLDLPSWITAVTPKEMASLERGDTATVVLRLCPTDDMQLNVPVTGTMAINCENGDGLSLPYNIEPVSETTGTLVVDVCDEFTYYTSEAPHLSGAVVKVLHPTSGAVVAQGVTDGDGLFTQELPEGYYTIAVSAEKHESYREVILVDPGVANRYVVNIPYNAITVDWVVERTEVEDEYKIVTNVVYEASVPMPVVLFDVPESINGDSMAVGETKIVYFTAKNVGLIKAMNVCISIPEDGREWRFEALEDVGPFDLGAQQSVVIPVAITRLDPTAGSNAKKRKANFHGEYNDCMAAAALEYEFMCGTQINTNRHTRNIALKSCGIAVIGSEILDKLSDILNKIRDPKPNNPARKSDGGGATGTVGGPTLSLVGTVNSFLCNPCDAKKAEQLLDFFLDKTFLAAVNDGMNDYIEELDRRRESKNNGERRQMTLDSFKDFCNWLQENKESVLRWVVEENVPGGDYLLDAYDVINTLAEECPADAAASKANRTASDRSWQTNFSRVSKELGKYLLAFDAAVLEDFGDRVWMGGDMDARIAFFDYLLENEDCTLQEALAMKPADVTDDQAETLFARLENVAKGSAAVNSIDFARLDSLAALARTIDDKAVRNGFENISAEYSNAYDVCMENYAAKQTSVCASITLQFSQSMVMTRQAFRGTLTVFNGNDLNAMENVRLNLVVKNAEGVLATSHEFQINMESLDGFEGELGFGGWSLDAQQTGVATVLFIPTKYAAPTYDVNYSFGGSLSYIDPYTGLEVTRELAPVVLSVEPSPSLDITYFMQRDIFGDDPFTDEVEPSVPAEFALLINNTGYGDATNVRMLTEQPRIIENEKGLLVDFELLGSELNGKDKSLPLGGTIATDFGLIPAKSTAYAKWMLNSSLLGHFTEYDVEATHVSSYGNPDLSLLNNVTIHELVRSIDVVYGKDTLAAFVTNDIVDSRDVPDMIYLSNGDVETVAGFEWATIEKVADNVYRLTLKPSLSGWAYGNVIDPTYGVSELLSVVRESDGCSISLRNFWQTDRTLRDGLDPLYEHRIHFVDEFDSAVKEENYLLTFKDVPATVLAVKHFVGTPEELSLEPLKELFVVFNKPIVESTFTADDIAVACQGKRLETTGISISKVSATEYKLDLSQMAVENGYYVLTVQTAGIQDADGYFGKSGAQTSWIQWLDGKVPVSVVASSVAGGTVAPESGMYDYGQEITLIAEPADGYTFIGWELDGEPFGNEKEFAFTVLENASFTALFAAENRNVSVVCDTLCGAVKNCAPGIYECGTELQFVAVPAPDYAFTGWIVNGEGVACGDTLSLAVTEDVEVEATFVRVVYHHKMPLFRGWNWASSYIYSSVGFNALGGCVDRVIGQDGELSMNNGTELARSVATFDGGYSYKIKSSVSTIVTLSGKMHDIAENPIALQNGWNWISYPHYENCSLATAITNAQEGDFIVSHTGFAQYVAGDWVGTVENLEVGQGYLYKSVSAKNLAYDFSASAVPDGDEWEETADVDIRKYPHTMNVVAVVEDRTGALDAEACRVIALVGSELRGVSKRIDGKHFITVYGEDAAKVSFVVEDEVSGERYLINEAMTFASDVVGSVNEPCVLCAEQSASIVLPVAEDGRITIYNVHGVLLRSDATIKDVNALPAGLYIVNGQKLIVK